MEQQCCKLSELKGTVDKEVGSKCYNKYFCDNAKKYHRYTFDYTKLLTHFTWVKTFVAEMYINNI
jgi:hypothetical protein